ncbi:MAG TPA: HAD-IA family hydrolase [Acidimicrobiales bacterium]|nr:HAD-IA family hydrolase [Acidimicrobiales bacterium]
MIKAVLFDFGGVILTSPFETFAIYEVEAGLPRDTIRNLNATKPDTNAWAKFERREINTEEFIELFQIEAAEQGFVVDARKLIENLHGALRPNMVEALRRCSNGLKTAMLTNNITPIGSQPLSSDVQEVVQMFDVVIESSVEGCRKPEQKFYDIACERLNEKPEDCVFLDDLGVNLKPARTMGMTTIKVVNPEQAIAELSGVVGFSLD